MKNVHPYIEHFYCTVSFFLRLRDHERRGVINSTRIRVGMIISKDFMDIEDHLIWIHGGYDIMEKTCVSLRQDAGMERTGEQEAQGLK